MRDRADNLDFSVMQKPSIYAQQCTQFNSKVFGVMFSNSKAHFIPYHIGNAPVRAYFFNGRTSHVILSFTKPSFFAEVIS